MIGCRWTIHSTAQPSITTNPHRAHQLHTPLGIGRRRRKCSASAGLNWIRRPQEERTLPDIALAETGHEGKTTGFFFWPLSHIAIRSTTDIHETAERSVQFVHSLCSLSKGTATTDRVARPSEVTTSFSRLLLSLFHTAAGLGEFPSFRTNIIQIQPSSIICELSSWRLELFSRGQELLAETPLMLCSAPHPPILADDLEHQ